MSNCNETIGNRTVGSGPLGGQTDTVAGSNGITNTGDNINAILTPTYGNAANEICEGDDARLSDDRDPNLHGISDNLRHGGVGGATTGNFVEFDANGLPADNGNKPSDFEPAFAKNTAFNKDFGSGSGDVCEGDDSRLTDDRDPNLHGISDNLRHSGVGGAVTDNLMSFDGNGLPKDSGIASAILAALGVGNALWVNAAYAGGGSDGSFLKPYTSLLAAIAALSTETTIFLLPGTYSGAHVIPAGGPLTAIKGFDRQNTFISHTATALSGTSLTNSFRLEGVTVTTSSASATDAAFKIDGIGIQKVLYINNVEFQSSNAASFALWLKDMPFSVNSFADINYVMYRGKAYFENVSPIVHGLIGQSISGASPALEIKDSAAGFINDVAIINQNNTAFVIDNSTGITIRSSEFQTRGGSNDAVMFINGAGAEVTDFKIFNAGSGFDWSVDATSGFDLITAKWTGSISFDPSATIKYVTPASRLDNDSTLQPGSTIKDALDIIQLQSDVTLAGATPIQSDFSTWPVGGRGNGIGTDSSVWWVYKDGATSIKSVQMA